MLDCPFCHSIRIRNAGIQPTTRKKRFTCLDCCKYWQGEKLTFNKNASEICKIKQRYYDQRIYNIGYVDIETNRQLKADYGRLLTYGILIRNVKTGKTEMFKGRVKQKEIFNSFKTKLDFDRRIMCDLVNKIKMCDLIIGHYSNGWKKFDIPFLRVRAEKLKIKIPTYKMLKYGDTWNMAHSVFNLQGYGLEGVIKGLGFKNLRVDLTPDEWCCTAYAEKKSLDKLFYHNVNDVIMTYRIHKVLEKYVAIPSNYF